MKKLLLIGLFIVSFFSIAQTVSARGIIFYSTGLTYEVKEKLPEDVIINGSHVDFGISYDQFSIMWIPIWNYGSLNYAFIDKANKTIYDVTPEDAEYLKEEFGIDTSDTPKISFWNAFGGKIILGIVIVFVAWGWWKGRKEEKEKEEKELQELRDIQEVEERKKEMEDEEEIEEEDEEEEVAEDQSKK